MYLQNRDIDLHWKVIICFYSWLAIHFYRLNALSQLAKRLLYCAVLRTVFAPHLFMLPIGFASHFYSYLCQITYTQFNRSIWLTSPHPPEIESSIFPDPSPFQVLFLVSKTSTSFGYFLFNLPSHLHIKLPFLFLYFSTSDITYWFLLWKKRINSLRALSQFMTSPMFFSK